MGGSSLGDISQIGVKEIFPFDTLVSRLRETALHSGTGLPYAAASIEMREYLPESLNLTTGYVLRESLLFQERLREHLIRRFGIDTLSLDCLVILDTPQGEVPLAPPVVEHMYLPVVSPQQPERGCARLSLDVLLDGAHRCYLARRIGATVQCVRVSGVDELYQVPIVPNGWNEVAVMDVVPERRFKKRYLGESIVMYRDFSSLGSTGYRK